MNVKAISTNVGKALLVSALFMFLSIMVSLVNGRDSGFGPLTISFIITRNYETDGQRSESGITSVHQGNHDGQKHEKGTDKQCLSNIRRYRLYIHISFSSFKDLIRPRSSRFSSMSSSTPVLIFTIWSSPSKLYLYLRESCL